MGGARVFALSPGFGFRVSGLKFRVSGIGFLVYFFLLITTKNQAKPFIKFHKKGIK
jgi:hypothetical protein